MPETEPPYNPRRTEATEAGFLFDPGQVVWTPGVQSAFSEANQSPVPFLQRHLSGDWGEVPPEDKQANDNALERGLRLFSAYRLQTNVKFWLITEWDRSVTTFLLPSEY